MYHSVNRRFSRIGYSSGKDEDYMVSIQLAKVRSGVYQLTKAD